MASVQQRFDENTITREEWTWVEELIRDVAQEEERNTFVKNLFEWHLAVRQFRKIEQKRIILGAPTPVDMECHALCLHGLLTMGHGLVLQSQQFKDSALAQFNVRHEEIAAYVEELEQSLREWHHGFAEKDLESVRKSVFIGAA